MARAASLAGAVLALVSLAVHAQYTYRCTTVEGKKYYGETIPPQCFGQPIEQLNSNGTVMRRMDPEGDAKARKAREAEAAKQREEELLQKDQARRNRALLATYASEKDIDEARERALGENQKAIKEIEARIAEIRKRQAAYAKELEFYTEGAPKADAKKKGTPAPAKAENRAPPKLLEDIKNAEVELRSQETLLAAKQKEVDGINAKYDEDKKRYTELTNQRPTLR